jgi:hydroxyacylglutathione hydrolase
MTDVPLKSDVLPAIRPGTSCSFTRARKSHSLAMFYSRARIGRCDLPRGNFNQLVESITSRLWPLGDDMQFVPGHGPMSTFGWERKTNPYVSDLALGRA